MTSATPMQLAALPTELLSQLGAGHFVRRNMTVEGEEYKCTYEIKVSAIPVRLHQF